MNASYQRRKFLESITESLEQGWNEFVADKVKEIHLKNEALIKDFDVQEIKRIATDFNSFNAFWELVNEPKGFRVPKEPDLRIDPGHVDPSNGHIYLRVSESQYLKMPYTK